MGNLFSIMNRYIKSIFVIKNGNLVNDGLIYNYALMYSDISEYSIVILIIGVKLCGLTII